MTKERPILFSAPMVRAILDGTKTQTRRIINPQPEVAPDLEKLVNQAWQGGWVDVACPYGEPGDRLWVKETWSTEGRSISEARAAHEDAMQGLSSIYYRATEGYPESLVWRPSIHMPRWASRLTLEVTSVRVERLHDISEDDARAEGVRPKDAHVVIECDAEGRARLNEALSNTHRGAFACLWDTINGGGAFASNPWVWVVIFKRVDA